MAKFLLVDDSEYTRYSIAQVLNSLGHKVVTAENGRDGYRLARAHDDFDFILSDFNMPIWDGFTMIEKIRAIEGYKKTPIGMLTTETSKNLKMRGKQLGVCVWFIKPLDPRLFERSVAVILNSEKPA